MTTRDTERLEVRAVLGEADDSCVIQQSAALEVEDLETCAMGEEVTKHFGVHVQTTALGCIEVKPSQTWATAREKLKRQWTYVTFCEV